MASPRLAGGKVSVWDGLGGKRRLPGLVWVIWGAGMCLGGLLWKEMDTAGKQGCIPALHMEKCVPITSKTGVSPAQRGCNPSVRAGRKRRPLTQSPREISSCAGLRTRMIWPQIIQVARHMLLPSTLISRFGQSEEGGCTSPGGGGKAAPRKALPLRDELCLSIQSLGFQGSPFGTFHRLGKEFDNEFGARC